MRPVALGRAAFGAVAILTLSLTPAFAETLVADADVVTPGQQTTVDLGTAAPGADVATSVSFLLSCSGTNHVDPGQSVRLTLGARTVPAGGGFSVGGATITPPVGWPSDGSACPAGLDPVVSAPIRVVVTAPPTPGFDDRYTFTWNRTLLPATAGDAGVFEGPATTVTFLLDVVEPNDLVEANAPWPLTGPSAWDIGTTDPGGVVSGDLAFILDCSGTNHVNDGATVSLHLSGGSVPDDGSLDATTGTIGPVSGWVADGDACDGETFATGSPSHVTFHAPTTEGTWTYVLTYTPSVSDGDPAVTEAVKATFSLTVSANTAPTLTLPADETVEGNTSGGATVTWTASAADSQDATAPTVSCTPASGTLLPLGPTTIHCQATDAGGLTTTGSFTVTVVDTTAPTLSGLPASISLTTTSPSGALLSYTAPSATDVVDPAPVVACLPAAGATVPVGDSTVTCTATDASGNASSASFPVHVSLASVLWDEPITNGALTANGSRVIPVKARLFLDGVELRSGAGSLRVVPCDGGAALGTTALTWQSGRWSAHLDTTGLATGCYRAIASIDGSDVASFRLDVRGGTTTAPSTKRPKSG